MKRAIVLLVALAFSQHASAANHGPLFGLTTPTNSQGEWNFDEGVFARTTRFGSQASHPGTPRDTGSPHISRYRSRFL